MVKEEVVELLKKDKTCDIIICNLLEDHEIACNVNDQSRVRFLFHNVLPDSDMEIVSEVGVAGIQSVMQRYTSGKLSGQLGLLNQKY